MRALGVQGAFLHVCQSPKPFFLAVFFLVPCLVLSVECLPAVVALRNRSRTVLFWRHFCEDKQRRY